MLLVRVLDAHVILFRSRLNPSVPSAVFFSCRIVGLGLCARSCQLMFRAATYHLSGITQRFVARTRGIWRQRDALREESVNTFQGRYVSRRLTITDNNICHVSNFMVSEWG